MSFADDYKLLKDSPASSSTGITIPERPRYSPAEPHKFGSSIGTMECNTHGAEDPHSAFVGRTSDLLSPQPNQENLGPQPSTPRKLSSRELSERDRHAIAYSKSLLQQGDTLVYIGYPSNTEVYDHTGFLLSTATPFRVHSHKLLATGSKVFKDLFSEWPQAKFKRRKGYFNGLPRGIDYIIDLTPPDEGDEAVELTSELSCSLGIRHWYSAERRCKVSAEVCGGKDEVAQPFNTKSKPVYKDHHDLVDALADSDIRRETNVMSDITNFALIDDELETSHISPSSPKRVVGLKQREEQELQQVLERSKKEFFNPVQSKPKDCYKSVDEIPEYCPIRHRAGIERLLQLIEGKEPLLDSAPKVWTLFVLAKYLDCTAFVVDFIVSWVLREPNCQFIEILPEATLKMGLGLKSAVLTRPAFAILVSEHALSTISRKHESFEADKANTSQFGRLREDIDEDVVGGVQEAANSFQTRIEKVLSNLCDKSLPWLNKLPEYEKINFFIRWAENNSIGEPGMQLMKDGVARLKSGLAHFVRGRILWRLGADLSFDDQTQFNSHRLAETYAKEPTFDPASSCYFPMAEKEKMMTKYPWEDLRTLDFGTVVPSNPLFDVHGVSERQARRNKETAELHGVQPVSMYDLFQCQTKLNEHIMMAIRLHNYNFGFFPAECYLQRQTLSWADDSDNGDLDSTKVSKCPSKAAGFPTGQDLKAYLEPQDAEKQENVESSASSTTGLFNFPLRPKIPEDAEKVPPLDKKSYPGVSFSSDVERNDLSNAGESSTMATTSSLFNRISNIINASSNFLSTQHTLTDPRAQAMNFHNQFVPASGPISQPNFQQLYRGPISPTVIIPPHNFTKREPGIPEDWSVQEGSPFFSLRIFFNQVQTEVRRVASTILDTGDELDFTVLTDTLLCLTDEEWKYLPLWAGGNDDGSGGVFEAPVPPAPPGAGPSGPGPAFHTGYSMTSREGTEADYDGTSTIGESVDTSVAVENGYSDHFDRRRVISEDEEDFGSEAFSDDTIDYVGKGKGKAAMHTPVSESTDEPERTTTPKPDTLVGDEAEWDGFDEEEAFDFGEETHDDDDEDTIMF